MKKKQLTIDNFKDWVGEKESEKDARDKHTWERERKTHTQGRQAGETHKKKSKRLR